MSINYAKRIPIDEQNNPMQEYPAPFKALARYNTNNATVSSVITLTDSTTVVEITAPGADVAVRWVPATEGAGGAPFASVISQGASINLDHLVPRNTVRRFVVPVEGIGTSSIVGANVANGLYKRVAVMSAVAVSSILVLEF